MRTSTFRIRGHVPALVLLAVSTVACEPRSSGERGEPDDTPVSERQAAAGMQPWAMVPLADIEFTPNPYGASAVLWGDPTTGPYGSLNRFPPGTVIPLHTHTNDGHVIVIRRMMYNYRDGDPQLPLGPGSHLSEPGGVPHVTRCGPDAECLVLATQEKALDFNILDSATVRERR